MELFQQRVLNEHRDLEERIASLGAFQLTPTFAALEATDRSLLMRQCSLMIAYSEVLRLRIERFT